MAASLGEEVLDQLEVNALQQRPHVFQEQLQDVSKRRAKRAHVIRNGIQHTHHQVSVIPLQLNIVDAATATAGAGAAVVAIGIGVGIGAAAVIIVVVLIVAAARIHLDRVAAVGALQATMRPGHWLLKLVQVRQILIDIEQRMIDVGAALVTPN